MEANKMTDKIIQSFDIWTGAQGLKSKGRVKSVDNISLEGIARLRELILELAVRGKLVPQNPNDEPASELLKKIYLKREKLIKAGIIRKEKAFLDISEKGKPFNLPDNWSWCRLGSVIILVSGQDLTTAEYNDNGHGIPYITGASHFDNGNISISRWTDQPKSISKIDDLLITCKGTIGEMAFNNIGDIHIARQIMSIRNLFDIDLHYIKLFLSFFVSELLLNAKSLIPGITRDDILEIALPFPPLALQNRIVAKVDELMALCDKLETQQFNNLKTHEALVKTLLETLTQAADANELQSAWQRLSTHFDTLFCTENSIDQLKQTILQLAVMGKLVKQNPNDLPANELLKKIAKEKEKLVKVGKIKKQEKLSEIGEEEKPFKLPESWEWIKFGELSQFINGDRSKNYPHTSEYLNVGIPWINTGHIEPTGKLTTTDMNFISREKFDSLRSGKIQKGDLVYCLRGATFGKTAFVEPYDEGAIASSLMIIRPHNTELKSFIFLYLISPLAKQQLLRFDNGSAQPNLSANSVLHYAFPLPPLAEQNRIVTRVDSLFALCDTLKEKLIKSQEIKGLLAKAVVEGAVG